MEESISWPCTSSVLVSHRCYPQKSSKLCNDKLQGKAHLIHQSIPSHFPHQNHLMLFPLGRIQEFQAKETKHCTIRTLKTLLQKLPQIQITFQRHAPQMKAFILRNQFPRIQFLQEFQKQILPLVAIQTRLHQKMNQKSHKKFLPIVKRLLNCKKSQILSLLLHNNESLGKWNWPFLKNSMTSSVII